MAHELKQELFAELHTHHMDCIHETRKKLSYKLQRAIGNEVLK